jgi:hypothetical protein
MAHVRAGRSSESRAAGVGAIAHAVDRAPSIEVSSFLGLCGELLCAFA